MELDLDVLEYLTGKGGRYIEEAVRGTSYLPRTVKGVATFLLDLEGNVDLLTAKQKVTFEKFLLPLLFDVPCRGLAGGQACQGSGVIEAELLLKCYRDDEFRCHRCRATLAEQTAE